MANEIMTNTALLNEYIAKSGLKKNYLAEKCGLSGAGFANCCNNRAEFKASQIAVLCKLLNISSAKERERIFFARYGA